ncbi:MAG TPA: ABC transporter ATP-binding protein [Bryobacteraceae bacterium]|nr:ABC transporter ATP-binding protein [Bryobacteraceae bacterium]
MAEDSILELRRVSKAFGSHRAVSNLSLTIPRGSFFSLLGPSGCGKTTTLRLVAGFENPDEGEIWLSGSRLAGPGECLPPYRRNVNTVFQNYALFPHLTVRGNIEFGLRRRRDSRPAAAIEARVRAVLEQVRLAGKDSRRTSQLSGGERQRVALARSLVLEPDVLLLDEPLSALDPQLRKQVRAELKDLQRRVGITFLFVTHDQEEALSMSDFVAVMDRGALAQVGPPEEVYRRPATRFVASFLGAMNWIGGVGLRPEALRLSRHPAHGSRRAIVTGKTFLGPLVYVEARLETGEACSAQASHSAACFQAGETVHVWWDAADEVKL